MITTEGGCVAVFQKRNNINFILFLQECFIYYMDGSVFSFG